MSRRLSWVAGLTLFSLIPIRAASAQSTRYVDPRTPAATDGQSWATAYFGLDDALADAGSNATVTEIRIAAGEYRPTEYHGVYSVAYYIGRNNLAIRGGYAGNARPSDPDARDTRQYRTTLIFGSPAIILEDIDSTVMLEGLRFEHNSRGILAHDASPVVKDCLFESNHGPDAPGGAVYCDGGSPIFLNCTFRNNSVFRSNFASGSHGGACYFSPSTSPTLVNCVIHRNRASDGARGRGTLDDNVSGLNGGHGGGIYNESPHLTLINCVVAYNRAGDGGEGVRRSFSNLNGDGGDGGDGGGIYSTVPGVLTVNCTAYGNMAGVGGSGASGGTAPPGTDGASGSCGGLLNADIHNSIVTGNIPDDLCSSVFLNSLVGIDPRFVDANGRDNIAGNADDDLRPRPESPVIDAGNNLLVPFDVLDLDGDGDTAERTPLDLYQAPRFTDAWPPGGPGVSDPPEYADIVDIGAYEYRLEPDCNTNSTNDSIDIVDGVTMDCNTNGTPDLCDVGVDGVNDCNTNSTPDECDIRSGSQSDCNTNRTPDRCDITLGEVDCNTSIVPDVCELRNQTQGDCNGNGVIDRCDIAAGLEADCTTNGTPDQCEPDCNTNGTPDSCDIGLGGITDCNTNQVPDECDLRYAGHADCDTNGTPDRCDIRSGASDCNTNNKPDRCELQQEPRLDCNTNGSIDRCDHLPPGTPDCNSNGADDMCEIAFGGLSDCNTNLRPDMCDPISGFDCNTNHTMDACDIGSAWSADCNTNRTPDECDLRTGLHTDCDTNGTLDLCDLDLGGAHDCNTNTTPDLCEVDSGLQSDCDTNGTLDRCDLLAGADDCDTNSRPDICSTDCDTNDAADVCELVDAPELDCNANATPDLCDLASGLHPDCNTNLSIDYCETQSFGALDCNHDQIPDECQPDCDTNGSPDNCDIAAGAADCNTNLTLDECDYLAGIAGDCDGNGAADLCELNARTADYHSDSMSPFDFFNPRSFRLFAAPDPAGPVTISVRTRTRLATNTRWVDVYLGAEFVGRLFENDGVTCPMGANFGAIVVSRDVFNAAREDGDVEVRVIPNASVTPPSCSTFVSLTVSFELGFDRDCNTNGLPDTCDLFCGDLDVDGEVDDADFSLFLLAFGHGYGDAAYFGCADLDGDRMVTLIDYQRWLRCYRDFIGAPTTAPPQPADMGDMNGDGLIDADDIQPFVQALLAAGNPGLRTLLVADFSGDGDLGPADVAGFVERLRGAD